MSADILGTSWDQCRSMVQYIFTSTEARRLVRTDSPGRPPRLSHSSWTMSFSVNSVHALKLSWFCCCWLLHTCLPSLHNYVQCFFFFTFLYFNSLSTNITLSNKWSINGRQVNTFQLNAPFCMGCWPERHLEKARRGRPCCWDLGWRTDSLLLQHSSDTVQESL